MSTPTPQTHASSQGSITPTPTDAANSSAQDPTEVTAVVDDLLDGLSSKFASVSSEIYGKIEAMSKRLDMMEESLKQQQTEQAATTKQA